jgi:transcriptional regulator with XRE-family HTH domain
MTRKQRTTEWEAAVGERLQRLRLDRGLSQSRLAALAGVPFRSLQNYEQGHRPTPLEAATKLAKALGVSLDVLVGLAEAPPAGQGKPGPKPRGKKK